MYSLTHIMTIYRNISYRPPILLYISYNQILTNTNPYKLTKKTATLIIKYIFKLLKITATNKSAGYNFICSTTLK